MQIQISWLLQKPTDLDLHCLLRQGMPCSAREGLRKLDKLGRYSAIFYKGDNFCGFPAHQAPSEWNLLQRKQSICFQEEQILYFLRHLFRKEKKTILTDLSTSKENNQSVSRKSKFFSFKDTFSGRRKNNVGWFVMLENIFSYFTK